MDLKHSRRKISDLLDRSPPLRDRHPSIGAISYSAKGDDDLVGLDEAVQNFSIAARAASQPPGSPDRSSTTSTIQEIPLSPLSAAEKPETSHPMDHKEDIEIATEATNINEELTRNISDPSLSTSETPQTGTDLRIDKTNTEYHSTESHESSFVMPVASAHRTRPIRPPPFNPRSHTSMADTHAFIDSFPTSPPDAHRDVNSALSDIAKGSATIITNNPPPSMMPEPSDSPDRSTSYSANTSHTNASHQNSIEHSKSMDDNLSSVHSEKIFIHEAPKDSPPMTPSFPTSHLEFSRSSPPVIVSDWTKPRGWLHVLFDYRWKLNILSSLVLFSACCYYLSSFISGILVGIVLALLFSWLARVLFNPSSSSPICPISGLPYDRLCCSFHAQHSTTGRPHLPVYAPALPPLRAGLPQLRDLQPYNVPHMIDDDPKLSSTRGPLSRGLGFELDESTNHPIYRGWMNEKSTYDPETHHISQTRSVYVTLKNTNLQLQRPTRNIARRSMWNDVARSPNFKNTRTFELLHARITLLPNGLIPKRLWSKKYPIAITFASGSPDHSKDTHPASLHSSASVPDIPSCQHRGGSIDSRLSNEGGDTKNDSLIVYMFGRTCREKEAWYRRLRAASLGVPLLWTPQLATEMLLSEDISHKPPSPKTDSEDDGEEADAFSMISDQDIRGGKNPNHQPSSFGIPGSREPSYLTYIRHMAKFMPADWLLRGSQALRVNVNYVDCENSLIWLNAYLARLLWDFLREDYWLKRVRDKIQAKLKKLHLPHFISDLVVGDIKLGSTLPVIRHIGRPYLDAEGLWCELDMAYAGGFSVALETKVNLLGWNAKSRTDRESENIADDTNFRSSSRYPKLGATRSDEEDSVDSTTESESGGSDSSKSQIPLSGLRRKSVTDATNQKPMEEFSDTVASNQQDYHSQRLPRIPSRKRLFRLVDRVTQSSYFQNSRLVQRGMDFLSDTPLSLEIEAQHLSGTMLVNIPAPPSDRLWFGFRAVPQLRLKAQPRFGAKVVTMSRILDWIEKRCLLEFQRLVVLPNMVDITMPLLLPDVSSGEPK